MNNRPHKKRGTSSMSFHFVLCYYSGIASPAPPRNRLSINFTRGRLSMPPQPRYQSTDPDLLTPVLTPLTCESVLRLSIFTPKSKARKER